MQKICTNCKQTNPSEAMFCRQCASPLGAAQPNQQQYANPQQQQGNQQQWNQQNFGNQPVQNFSQAGKSANNRPMLAAGLAVAGLFCCGFLTGIPAAILGWLEIQSIKEGKSSPDGMMMAQVGLYLGIAGTIINAILNVIGLLLLGMGGRY